MFLERSDRAGFIVEADFAAAGRVSSVPWRDEVSW